ncbi:unnamed protein product [Ectocarpus sp. 13 AM-2016]
MTERVQMILKTENGAWLCGVHLTRQLVWIRSPKHPADSHNIRSQASTLLDRAWGIGASQARGTLNRESARVRRNASWIQAPEWSQSISGQKTDVVAFARST